MRTAVGLTTYNRPRFADKSIRALERAVRPLDCVLSAANDCSDEKYRGEYKRAYARAPEMTVIEIPANGGVAKAKNVLLRWMLDTTDAEWLFLLEDDIILNGPEAVTGYIEAAERTGMHHLSFAHHGPANAAGPSRHGDPVEFYPHSIGAWTMFSRECLETVGLFDENFHNAWEHVEHELRLIAAGFMPEAAPHYFPDATGSRLWLSELPSAIEESAIRPRGDWQSSIVNGLRYWRESKPETFEMLFGAGTPLEGYAASLLAQ